MKQSDRHSFCGHSRSKERHLVARPDMWICSGRVALFGKILAQSADSGSPLT